MVRQYPFTLRTRIMISAGFGISVLILTLGIIGTQIIQGTTNKILEERRRTAEHLANHLDSILAADAARLDLLAQSSLMRREDSNLVAAKQLMREIVPQMELFKYGLFLLDQKGRVLTSEPERPSYLGVNLATLLPVREALGTAQPTTSGLLWTPDGIPVAMHVHPIAAPGGRLKGLVVGTADLSGDTLLPYLGGGRQQGTEHGAIIDGDGWVLASTEPEKLFTRGEHPELFTDLIKKGLSTVSVTRGNETVPGHGPHVMAAAPLRNSTWSIGLGQSVKEAMLPVSRLRFRVFLFGLAAVVLAVSYAWWDTGKVTRPLLSLTLPVPCGISPPAPGSPRLEGDAIGAVTFSPETEGQLIRIIREALNNIAKHSGARQASVRIELEGMLARIVIADDGRGFDPMKVLGAEQSFLSTSLGLLTMKERAESVGGSLEIHSAPGRGTRLVVRLPLARERG